MTEADILFATMVLPCRNESMTVAAVVREAVRLRMKRRIGLEVVVVDNGSTDGSGGIARATGARVVNEPRRGYGRALRTGVEAARGEYVVFVDADGEHPMELVPALVRAVVDCGADLGIASRMAGGIERGAMHCLHRYVGTPVLTWLINRLYGGTFTDCMSGMRCVKREWFLAQNFRCDGMEFASEMLIRAMQSGAKVVEIPGGMRRGMKGRRSHLRTWRDGWRHLRAILAMQEWGADVQECGSAGVEEFAPAARGEKDRRALPGKNVRESCIGSDDSGVNRAIPVPGPEAVKGGSR